MSANTHTAYYLYTCNAHLQTLAPCDEMCMLLVHCDEGGICADALCRYPWHVVFTGIRILIESRGILNYVGDNNNGYQ